MNRESYQFGDWLFSPSINTLFNEKKIDNKNIDDELIINETINKELINKEIIIEPHLGQLLRYLVERPYQVISRDELIEFAWPGVVSDAAVNQAIAKLRKALNDNVNQPQYIQTISKQGYRFICDVSITQASAKTEASITKTANPKAAKTKTNKTEIPPIISRAGKSISYITKKSIAMTLAVTLLLTVSLIYYLTSSFLLFSENNIVSGASRPITSLPGLELYPAFHPSQSRLVFSAVPENQQSADLVLADNKGNVIKKLTDTPTLWELRSAWSPDGSALAYVELSKEGCEIKLMSNVLSQHQTVSEIKAASQIKETPEILTLATCDNFDIQIAWLPNGKELLFNRRAYPGGPFRVYKVRIADQRLLEISQANDAITGDIAFDVSPDGNTLAVMRTYHWNQSSLWLLDLQDKSAIKIREFEYWIKSLKFDHTGENLIFAAPPFYQKIVSYNLKKDRLMELAQLPHRIADPQFTPDGQLSYVMRRFNSDIVSKNLSQPPAETSESTSKIATIIGSTQQDWHPSISPDGQTLAFMSNRTGNTEIWLKQFDDNTEILLTQLEGSIVPHRMNWSPDGDALIFDSEKDQLFLLTLNETVINNSPSNSIQSGPKIPEQLRQLEHKARNPRWTKTGIYYSTFIDEQWQVYHLPKPNALPIKSDIPAGFSAEPLLVHENSKPNSNSNSNSNNWLLTKFYLPGFWRFANGKEASIIANGLQGPFNQWQQTTDGLYYLASGPGGGPDVYFQDRVSQQSRFIASINNREMPGFSVSAENRSIYYTQVKQRQADIMIFE